MSYFRSEPMVSCQLMMRTDSAYNCLSELGELGMVQFNDMNADNSSFKKKFVPEVRRCEELERKLGFLMNEMKQRDIPIHEKKVSPSAATEKMMIEFEAKVEQLEKEVKMVSKHLDLLTNDFRNLMQMKHLMKKTQSFFEQMESYELNDVIAHNESSQRGPSFLYDNHSTTPQFIGKDRMSVMTFEPIQISTILDQGTFSDLGHSFHLRIVTGVVSTDKLLAFEKILFRVSRGNVYVKSSNIEVPITSWNSKETFLKTVFIIFLQGDQLMNKVLKVCEGFNADIYSCPESSEARRRLSTEVMTRLEELNIVLNQTQDHLMMLLMDAAKHLSFWSISVMKAKAIYHTLNLLTFDSTSKTLLGECWCPAAEFNNIQAALKLGTDRAGMTESAAILHKMSPKAAMPTYHKTNKVTSAIQGIIDAYGISNYMEINPAIFSTITFPFLFSIMFGDIGHGLIVCLVALFVIIYENRLSAYKSSEVFGLFFTARYLILLMGLFSVYSGFMYNDLFSRPVRLFHSCWHVTNDTSEDFFYDNPDESYYTFDSSSSSNFHGGPYPFGMDPLWQISTNKVQWLNSFKMKLSIILGIFHMSFGIFLNFMNQRYNKNKLNIFCEVIPQAIFLMSTFGYMVFLIIHKWIAYSPSQSSSAPSILIGFINMFLLSYPTEPPHLAVSEERKMFQMFLLSCAFICVPWMLLVKPFIIFRRMRQNRSMSNSYLVSYQALQTDDNNTDDVRLLLDSTSDEDDGYQFNESASPMKNHKEEFMEMFIEQCITTIEFCLGCVSHTASYLRLWALSLAHGQLSEILWDSIFRGSLSSSEGGLFGLIVIVIGFAFWASLTVVILLCMEGLSAFLHTLRLHWIEFMSKFYKGEGKPFQPFLLNNIHLNLLEERAVH